MYSYAFANIEKRKKKGRRIARKYECRGPGGLRLNNDRCRRKSIIASRPRSFLFVKRVPYITRLLSMPSANEKR